MNNFQDKIYTINLKFIQLNDFFQKQNIYTLKENAKLYFYIYIYL